MEESEREKMGEKKYNLRFLPLFEDDLNRTKKQREEAKGQVHCIRVLIMVQCVLGDINCQELQ